MRAAWFGVVLMFGGVLAPIALSSSDATAATSTTAMSAPPAVAATPTASPVIVPDCLDIRYPIWNGHTCVAASGSTAGSALHGVATPATGAASGDAPSPGGVAVAFGGGLVAIAAALLPRGRHQRRRR